ncbi:MAG TPA: hypothetical protein VMZ29_09815 [Candidatus Bathyarchaeia archaeon]|nr:hypothetical protein [Candidatus Bathyarchaeia archaeon]
MPLNNMQIYSCAVCGNALCGIEWEDCSDPEGNYEYKCRSCGHAFNEDELYSED